MEDVRILIFSLILIGAVAIIITRRECTFDTRFLAGLMLCAAEFGLISMM